MIIQEQNFVKKFFTKDKQERYLGFLSKDKSRPKFTKKLCHFKDLDWNLFTEIIGNSNQIVASRVKSYKNISTCPVISMNPEYDEKILPVDEAIENAIGIEGTILIFGHVEIVYYEGEPRKKDL